MTTTYVDITLPNTNKVMRIEKAGAGVNDDYAEAYSMRVGIGKAGELMVDAAKELGGYTAEVEWDAHALSTLEALSGTIQDWATTPPTVQDLLALYGSTLIQATPDKIHMHFTYVLPEAFVKQGYANYSTSIDSVYMEDIKRVPPEYPNWHPAGSQANSVFARPDGTYFMLQWAASNPPPAPAPGQPWVSDPSWDPKFTWQEWDIDWTKTKVYSMPDLKDLLPTWIDALGVIKDDLTKQSQTQMVYLQNLTEQYDRLLGFMQALLAAMKKLLEALINK